MRINKYIASCGVASRRKAEELILAGRVTVNDEVMTELSYKVDEENDIVKVDDKLIKEENKLVYILLNKPEGYITTVKDQFDRPSVLDLVSDIKERVYPIGRLDYETSGLLLLTNDGDLTYKLTHPKHEVDKTYVARVKGKLTKEDMVSLIKEKNITQIIDATHPYATVVSSNAIECSKITNIDYVRFERESLIKQIDYENKYVVENIEQACQIANEIGNIYWNRK